MILEVNIEVVGVELRLRAKKVVSRLLELKLWCLESLQDLVY